MDQGLTKNMPILIGEADGSVADRLRFLLEESGACVSVETMGSRVLDRVLNQSFELLIIAVQLPVLNGVDTLAFLRQHGVKTPAIGLVDAIDSDTLRGLNSGFAYLLDRTLAAEEIQAALNAVLNRNENELPHHDNKEAKTFFRAPLFWNLASRQARN